MKNINKKNWFWSKHKRPAQNEESEWKIKRLTLLLFFGEMNYSALLMCPAKKINEQIFIVIIVRMTLVNECASTLFVVIRFFSFLLRINSIKLFFVFNFYLTFLDIITTLSLERVKLGIDESMPLVHMCG